MSRFKAYAQLVRLPNVFTAFADILLAFPAVFHASKDGYSSPFALVAALAASGCLYSAGMVWNDFFDVEQDTRERPSRPIPSGGVTRRAAALLGTALMGLGLIFAVLAGIRHRGWAPQPLAVAGLLSVAILAYDAWLKRTWAGPLGMGLCRFLNVLLGQSAAVSPSALWLPEPTWQSMYPAAVVGLYIIGVTWFARTEGRVSSRLPLFGSSALMTVAVAAVWVMSSWSSGPIDPIFYCLLVGGCVFVGARIFWAIADPSPAMVQSAVKAGIFGLVILDAAIATVYWDVLGLVVLSLLLPAIFLGRWIYST